MDKDTNQALMIKGGAAWGTVGLSKYLDAIGINDWSDLAAMLAAIYSVILIVDWIWKRFKK